MCAERSVLAPKLSARWLWVVLGFAGAVGEPNGFTWQDIGNEQFSGRLFAAAVPFLGTCGCDVRK